MRVTILGAGAWGTALGVVLSQNAHDVVLWGHRPEQLREIERARRNEQYLPGVDLKGSWAFIPEIQAALEKQRSF
jgi:glycerol-3-phosphate dehydrogenase (NAD(P)+)